MGGCNNVARYNFAEKQYLQVENNLPNPFIKPDGKRVQERNEWEAQRI